MEFLHTFSVRWFQGSNVGIVVGKHSSPMDWESEYISPAITDASTDSVTIDGRCVFLVLQGDLEDSLYMCDFW